MKKIDSPHTISGLSGRRKELLSFLSRLDNERGSIIESLAGVDAALELFITPEIDLNRYSAPDPGSLTEFRAFVAEVLRTAGKAVSISYIAERWLIHRGLPYNRQTVYRAHARVGAYLNKLEAAGYAEMVGTQGNALLWESVND